MNDAGIEGLPLQLTVSMLVLAIALPIAWSWFDSYSLAQMEEDVTIEVDAILAAARQVYFHGAGNKRLLEVELHGSFGHSLEYVKVGDELPNGAHRCMVSYEITGRPARSFLMEPNIPLTTPQNECLVLGTGRTPLLLECVEGEFDGESVLYVEISLGG